ncbi:MAG: hypothetical protein J0H17_03090, partial [Rhizobiales bacterium]|nr:hypothetical protein [Hyphomicrobiales bacterium]
MKKPDSRPKPRVREHGTVLFPKPNEAIIGFDEEGVVALALEFAESNPQMSTHYALLDNSRDGVPKRR